MWDLQFPREVCTPQRRLVNNKQDFINFINQRISHQNLYTPVYNYIEFTNVNGYTKPKYDSAIIDRVYFDCDFYTRVNGTTKPVDGYQAMRSIHNWCCEKGYKHMCCFTGSGYNVIVSAIAENIRNKTGCVYNAQKYLMQELCIETDPQVMGDIARITRIPNTFNFKPSANKFVRCLTAADIVKGHDAIKEIANSQGPWHHIAGNAWDISSFDCEPVYRAPVIEVSGNVKPEDVDLPANAPECIKKMLNVEDLGFKQRPVLITWLRDHGYTLDETVGILQKCLSDKKFKHCVLEERQPQYIYSRALDLYHPRCETIKGMGFCSIDKICKERNNDTP